MEKKVMGIIIVIAAIAIVLVVRSSITGKLSYVKPTGPIICEDSDNTIIKDRRIDDYSYIVKGTTTQSRSGGERASAEEDFCNEDGKAEVNEYYCDAEERALLLEVTCETNKCENGACVGCYDSDNGKEIYNKGVAYFSDGVNSEVKEDECVIGFTNMVKEYSCESGKLVSEEIRCAGSRKCVDGYCRN